MTNETTEAPVEKKKRTITLTNRAPVRIVEDDWPIIAMDTGYTGRVEAQANEEWALRVRQHADGRSIVYGVRDRGPGGMAAGYKGSRSGELLKPGADIVAALHRVAEACSIPEDCIEGCIADLPAEDL